MTTASRALLASEEFHAPGPGSFELPAVFTIGGVDFTKPMLLLILSVPLIIAFTYLASRKAAVVPGRLQFAGEYVYGFVRNSLARDNIGSEHFMKFVPYLFSLFMFILVNNYFGIIPLLQFPSFSRISFIYPLAAITWLTYNLAGIWKHGFLGYLKVQTIPAGMGGPILILLIPLEFLSNFIIRPISLTLRLFGNMFAGHLLLILFATGGSYLILHTDNIMFAPIGVLSFGLGIGVSFLELLVLFLQAYVFTLLTAMYIGTAMADEH